MARAWVRDLSEHFWSRVDQSAGVDACWPWTLSCNSAGYGQAVMQQQRYSAHVFAYEDRIGPRPEGYEIDHLCHNRDIECPGGPTCLHRRCCNPAHLEAVPPHQNKARADEGRGRGAAKTHCNQGHPLDGVLVRKSGPRAGAVHRYCKQCNRDNQARRKSLSNPA